MKAEKFLTEKSDWFDKSPGGEKLYFESEVIRMMNDYANEALRIQDVSHSMTGDGMNCLEFFDMIKNEWCVSEEQYKPFWNDVLTFARKYHKERKEYSTITNK